MGHFPHILTVKYFGVFLSNYMIHLELTILLTDYVGCLGSHYHKTLL
jgi:hypothetical protein